MRRVVLLGVGVEVHRCRYFGSADGISAAPKERMRSGCARLRALIRVRKLQLQSSVSSIQHCTAVCSRTHQHLSTCCCTNLAGISADKDRPVWLTQPVRTYVSGGHLMPATLIRFWLSLLLGALLLAVTGCGSLATSDNTLTRGNWSVTARSANPDLGIFQAGGNLTQNGNALSATMYVSGSLCFDVSQPVILTGALKNRQVTLTSADVSGQVFSMVATETTDSALSGTYTITGGCGSGDHGTVSANVVPSISGTWSGSVIGTGGWDIRPNWQSHLYRVRLLDERNCH